MFGIKARTEISRLKNINDELRADVRHHLDRQIELAREIDKLDTANTQLVRDLREMDQLVYQMNAAGYPDQMRSAISRAWTITEKRMQAESARIASVLIPEIKKVYSEPKPTPGSITYNPQKRLR
jgi:vacuolar-type H+-ATPase subunit D/Vma8